METVKVTKGTGGCERTDVHLFVFICLVIRLLLLPMHNTGQCNLMKPLCSHKMSVSTAEYYQENIHY